MAVGNIVQFGVRGDVFQSIPDWSTSLSFRIESQGGSDEQFAESAFAWAKSYFCPRVCYSMALQATIRGLWLKFRTGAGLVNGTAEVPYEPGNLGIGGDVGSPDMCLFSFGQVPLVEGRMAPARYFGPPLSLTWQENGALRWPLAFQQAAFLNDLLTANFGSNSIRCVAFSPERFSEFGEAGSFQYVSQWILGMRISRRRKRTTGA